MPAYAPNVGTEEDMYSDAETSTPEAAEEGTEETAAGPSAEIPKSLLAGKDFQPGDEVVFKIQKIMDDTVVISYAPPKSDEEEEPPAAGEGEMAPPGGGGGGGGDEYGGMME